MHSNEVLQKKAEPMEIIYYWTWRHGIWDMVLLINWILIHNLTIICCTQSNETNGKPIRNAILNNWSQINKNERTKTLIYELRIEADQLPHGNIICIEYPLVLCMVYWCICNNTRIMND